MMALQDYTTMQAIGLPSMTSGQQMAYHPGLDNLTRSQARGVEQALIELYGLGSNGGTLMSQINSISPSNPVYPSAVQYGQEMLIIVNYPGAGGG